MDYLDPDTRARLMNIIHSGDTGEGRFVVHFFFPETSLKLEVDL